MHILVTGGVGYVGSHLVRALRDASHGVVVVDDLSAGHPETLPDDVELHVGSCGDAEVLDRAAATRKPDAVMHLAAKCSVEESVLDPALYYRINLRESLRLMDWMVAREVPCLVHSSTCAVYGSPQQDIIDETICPRPVNPYGASKLAVDLAMRAYEEAYPLSAISLRYFGSATRFRFSAPTSPPWTAPGCATISTSWISRRRTSPLSSTCRQAAPAMCTTSVPGAVTACRK